LLPLAANAAASAETAKAVSVPKREIRSAILIVLSLSLMKMLYFGMDSYFKTNFSDRINRI
jgi:hypothetical protein